MTNEGHTTVVPPTFSASKPRPFSPEDDAGGRTRGRFRPRSGAVFTKSLTAGRSQPGKTPDGQSLCGAKSYSVAITTEWKVLYAEIAKKSTSCDYIFALD